MNQEGIKIMKDWHYQTESLKWWVIKKAETSGVTKGTKVENLLINLINRDLIWRIFELGNSQEGNLVEIRDNHRITQLQEKITKRLEFLVLQI